MVANYVFPDHWDHIKSHLDGDTQGRVALTGGDTPKSGVVFTKPICPGSSFKVSPSPGQSRWTRGDWVRLVHRLATVVPMGDHSATVTILGAVRRTISCIWSCPGSRSSGSFIVVITTVGTEHQCGCYTFLDEWIPAPAHPPSLFSSEAPMNKPVDGGVPKCYVWDNYQVLK